MSRENVKNVKSVCMKCMKYSCNVDRMQLNVNTMDSKHIAQWISKRVDQIEKT